MVQNHSPHPHEKVGRLAQREELVVQANEHILFSDETPQEGDIVFWDGHHYTLYKNTFGGYPWLLKNSWSKVYMNESHIHFLQEMDHIKRKN